MTRTRRALLSSVAAGSVALAGCSLLGSETDPDQPPPSGVDELPDPGSHVHGATGDWSSFGANAGNTREVADGEAPVAEPSERWRVEVPGPTRWAPVVAGGRVFLPRLDALTVHDAADGSERWRAAGVGQPPLVRDGVAYVCDGDAVAARDAGTGEPLWERAFDGRGRVTAPATYAGEELVCGAGEQVVGLDPASGEVRWRREVFGQVLPSPATYVGRWHVVATTAGEVVALGRGGRGVWRWQLPAPPTCPPVAGVDSIYVNCRDGRTYALVDDGGGVDRGVVWSTRTGWADPGMALVGDLVVVAGGVDAVAVDGESGDRLWRHPTGQWDVTAPAHGRDTLFLGGDSLQAVDPTPDGDPSNGPARRWELSFDGHVGPGPTLDDGTLYVVARVDAERRRDALVALA